MAIRTQLAGLAQYVVVGKGRWQDTFVRQPPVRKLSLVIERIDQNAGYLRQYVIEQSDGLRLGHLVDRIKAILADNTEAGSTCVQDILDWKVSRTVDLWFEFGKE